MIMAIPHNKDDIPQRFPVLESNLVQVERQKLSLLVIEIIRLQNKKCFGATVP